MLEGKNPHGNLWSSYTEYEQYQFLKEEFELKMPRTNAGKSKTELTRRNEN